MIIIGQISIQSLTTHCDFFQFTIGQSLCLKQKWAKAERDWNKPITDQNGPLCLGIVSLTDRLLACWQVLFLLFANKNETFAVTNWTIFINK